jgi:hypothetical protein
MPGDEGCIRGQGVFSEPELSGGMNGLTGVAYRFGG